MTLSETMFIFAMFNICFVSFIWIVKQIIQLCYWYYKREENKNE